MKTALAMLAGLLAYGQAWEGNEAVIQARIRGGSSPAQGKCTAEVEVDGVAEVALSGSEGRIRTLSGQPASWRRLDCTGPIPAALADFRFRGVDGRGRQMLLQDPRMNRGVAVIRIEDPQGGREGYTFDVEWREGANWDSRIRGGSWRREGGGQEQEWERSGATLRARIRGGGGDRGQCTAEVDVDGVAEVGLRGDTGEIRTVSGQPAAWRRLECTGPLPANPAEFRFRGVDGRGRQELVADPRTNRGLAIVRIEDPQGGREAYTFEIEWRSGGVRPAGPGSGWGGGAGGWGNAPGSGWGNAPGTGWGGGGWGSGWGDTFSYRGNGSGMFSPESGAGYDLRSVFLTMDRRSGDVQMRFDSRLGADILQFRGRIERISGDVIEARLYDGVSRGDAAQLDARARIQLLEGGRVRAIQIEGLARGQRFRVNYAE